MENLPSHSGLFKIIYCIPSVKQECIIRFPCTPASRLDFKTNVIEKRAPTELIPSHYQTLQVWDPHPHLDHNLERHLDHPAQQVMTLAAAVFMHWCMNTIHVAVRSCESMHINMYIYHAMQY